MPHYPSGSMREEPHTGQVVEQHTDTYPKEGNAMIKVVAKPRHYYENFQSKYKTSETEGRKAAVCSSGGDRRMTTHIDEPAHDQKAAAESRGGKEVVRHGAGDAAEAHAEAHGRTVELQAARIRRGEGEGGAVCGVLTQVCKGLRERDTEGSGLVHPAEEEW